MVHDLRRQVKGCHLNDGDHDYEEILEVLAPIAFAEDPLKDARKKQHNTIVDEANREP